MIRTRLKKLLLVAPALYPEQLTAGYTQVKHVCSVDNIFPSIFEFNPDLVIFDYDLIGRDLEKVLRRIQANLFYSKIKISCYKNDPNIKIDGFLKVLGVDQFIYKKDLVTKQKNKTLFNTVSTLIDNSIIHLAGNVSN